MMTRSHSKSVIFSHPFELKGVDRILPAGAYRVVTDEELIEGLSFPVYRRVSTMIFVPARSDRASSVEMVGIDPGNLQAAQERDKAMDQAGAGTDQPSSESRSCDPRKPSKARGARS
jgi:hypothetical protein